METDLTSESLMRSLQEVRAEVAAVQHHLFTVAARAGGAGALTGESVQRLKKVMKAGARPGPMSIGRAHQVVLESRRLVDELTKALKRVRNEHAPDSIAATIARCAERSVGP